MALSPIWTIGHSSRPLDDFLDLLARYRLEALADVRRFPGSKRQPAYAQERLRTTLARRAPRRPRATAACTRVLMSATSAGATRREAREHRHYAGRAGGMRARLRGSDNRSHRIGVRSRFQWDRCISKVERLR